MSAIVMDCKTLAGKILDNAKATVKKYSTPPTLGIVQVGNNPASSTYVRGKIKDCEYCGIQHVLISIPEDSTADEIKNALFTISNDSNVNGVILQLPLPDHIDKYTLRNLIDIIPQAKDVDCLGSINKGLLDDGYQFNNPCTPAGIIDILDYYNIDVSGKNVVIIGRSNVVGRPLASMLLNKDATVTVCHSKTINLKEITSRADIIIAAVGKAKFVTTDMVKHGATVIDVGINRDENNHLCGDVDFDNVKEVASYITSVPGGIGLLTRAELIKNVSIQGYIFSGMEVEDMNL